MRVNAAVASFRLVHGLRHTRRAPSGGAVFEKKYEARFHQPMLMYAPFSSDATLASKKHVSHLT
ncbi:hypothetical protein FSB65_31110 [Paraburkholderia sp. JPY418]|uniref:Uncharacterized protein n=1 Tax=Paraburkholderia youngii TaxID=2782701 RepID=A0ABX2NX16_9BURK|nr:hypothetical protein [Paraburkholderia youngii]NVI08969.1 hypothetical protein [Paraburkholderia youngii]